MGRREPEDMADSASISPPEPAAPSLPRLVAVRYVTPLREGGSVPALVEADDGALWVVKLRGAGQGARALVAELIAGPVSYTHLTLPTN